MTDEELIAMARLAQRDERMSTGALYGDLADRIEALTKERDDYAHKLMQANNTYTEMHLEIEQLSDKLATCEKYRDAYAECDRIGTQAVRDLEAKLAKAEGDALRRAADMTLGLSTARACRTAILAMIPKGESHE